MIIQAPIFDMEEKVWTTVDMQTRKYLLSEIGMGDYRGVGFNESYLSTLYGEWKKENKETGITQRKFAEKNDMELSEFKKKVLRETVEAKRIIDDAVQKQFEKYILENKDEIFKIQLGLYKKAKQQTRNVEFEVKPGQIFSVYTMNGKEVQASLTKRGAYMKVAGNKMFAASEGFRKTMAAAVYGRGYGELCFIDATHNSSLTTIATTGTKVWLPTDAIMKIDIGTILDVKATIATGTIVGSAEVTAIDGNDVTLAAQTSAISVTPGTHILCLAGSVDASGNPLLPMGLDGWLPPVGNRVAGGNWDTYIANSFCGVTRSSASDRLAGAFVVGASSEKYSVTVQNLLMKCRRQGSQADIIVMNDEDFLTLSKEIEATNTYFTQTSTKGKKDATVGFNSFAASFSTNYIENIVDDPYCPKGKFYILDSSAIELFSYTNTEKLSDGINGNNPGKQNPLDMENEGKENSPYGLIIDDYINVQPGSGSDDGPDVEVTLQFFGSLAVTNPSVCGVGIFDNNTTYIGYGL